MDADTRFFCQSCLLSVSVCNVEYVYSIMWMLLTVDERIFVFSNREYGSLYFWYRFTLCAVYPRPLSDLSGLNQRKKAHCYQQNDMHNKKGKESEMKEILFCTYILNNRWLSYSFQKTPQDASCSSYRPI